jgi:uncharacterized RDD family membrane protein YckC
MVAVERSARDGLRGPLPPDETYTIETPEHVRLEYVVAGPGSRLVAALLDFLIMLVPSVLAFFLVVMVIATTISRESLESFATGGTGSPQEMIVWASLAFFALVQFVVMWFYFVIFEVAWNGQSPGKRALDIRVIRDGGQPVGLYTSMIRNLIRLVDFLPLFYTIGFIAMLASRHWRRLGDLAAGTVVVREDSVAGQRSAEEPSERGGEPPLQAPEAAGGVEDQDLARIDPAFFELGRRLLERRWQLEPHVVKHLAEKIARPVMERLGVTDVDPERFIERTVEGREMKR